MSSLAILHQRVRDLLQHAPHIQLKELRRVWPMIVADKSAQQPSLMVNTLKVCSKIGNEALSDGELIHNHLINTAVPGTPTSSIAPHQNLMIWNSLISMYTCCGAPRKALQLWRARHTQEPDKFSLSCVLSACAAEGGAEGLRVGREIQKKLQQMPTHLCDDILFSSLVNMYVKCNSPLDATRLWTQFNITSKRASKGTLKSFLKACADVGNKEALEIGHQIQAHVRTLQKSEVDMALHNSIINMLVKCGDATGAVSYWDYIVSIVEASELNAQIATSALLACAQLGPTALDRGKRIVQITNTSTAQQNLLYVSASISMYAKCGEAESALKVWRSFSSWFMEQKRNSPVPHIDVVCAAALGVCAMIENGIETGKSILRFAERYGCTPLTDLRFCNALMLMYAKCGEANTAIDLWNQLNSSKHLQPNEHSYVAILTACASKGQMAYELGRSISLTIKQDSTGGEQTILNVYAAIINMHGKCGSWEEAESFYNWCMANTTISESICNSIIVAYGEHGKGAKAKKIFEWMLDNNIQPTHITFLNLLNAYAHSGLVNEALLTFESMQSKFHITATKEHITCLVDALGRQGMLDKAEALVNSLPQCDAVVYSSLLSSCRLKLDVERAERVASKAISSSKQATPYILLGNTYMATKNFEKANQVRTKMEERGIQRKYSQSTVVIRGIAHTFAPNERRHSQNTQIQTQIELMERQLMKDGYMHDISCVMQDADEERKKHLLSRHSEKLALAYALLETPFGETIRIDNQLRICSDCHDAISRLSRIYTRTVILRDSRRFHHFKNGSCSCGGVY